MAGKYENFQAHISLDRVKNVDDVRELVKCFFCHGLVWQPVTCGNCEKTFCSKCIRIFQEDKSEKICVQNCSTYVEGRVPKIMNTLLNDRKICCCYQSNGCTEVLPYGALDQHEQACNYQWVVCDGCEQGVLKLNFDQHRLECQLVLIKCDQCSTSFRREAKHAPQGNECLGTQLRQQKSETAQLKILSVNQQTETKRLQQKAQQNKNFWEAFFATTKELRGMLNKQSLSETD